MENNFENIINEFSSISLAEMDEVKLMNRVDSKYVFGLAQFPELLRRVMPHYRILEVEGKRVNQYQTLYYDTPELTLYKNHHNGKKNRFKLRSRMYLSSGVTFLEIKKKNNKGRTIKERKKIDELVESFSENDHEFINSLIPGNLSFGPKLMNRFNRLTLVNRHEQERLTLDYSLEFHSYPEGQSSELGSIVVAEIKQEKINRNSFIIKLLKELHIRPLRISKYCVGTCLVNGSVKYNNFKEKIHWINKVSSTIS